MSRNDAVNEPISDFEAAASPVLRNLQEALSELVSHLPGHGKAADIERALGLDRKRGWQLHKIISARMPLAEVGNIPGAPTMRRILASAKRKVPRDVVDRATAAFERFERFVEEHGGSRAELVSLASGLTHGDPNDSQHEIGIRRSVFRGNAHIWGIRAQTLVRTAVYFPSGSDGTVDGLSILGYGSMQRLRHGVPLSVRINRTNTPDPRLGQPEPPENQNTLHSGEPLLEGAGLELLEPFCSKPLPQMESEPQSDGALLTNILFPPSSKSGAVTLYASRLIPGIMRTDDSGYAFNAQINIPCESMVLEMLVPRGVSNPATVRVAVYGRRSMIDNSVDRSLTDLLPQREVPHYLGVLDASPMIPDMPQHADAVRHAITNAGLSGTKFDVYRCSVEYPVMYTFIWLDVDPMDT